MERTQGFQKEGRNRVLARTQNGHLRAKNTKYHAYRALLNIGGVGKKNRKKIIDRTLRNGGHAKKTRDDLTGLERPEVTALFRKQVEGPYKSWCGKKRKCAPIGEGDMNMKGAEKRIRQKGTGAKKQTCRKNPSAKAKPWERSGRGKKSPDRRTSERRRGGQRPWGGAREVNHWNQGGRK